MSNPAQPQPSSRSDHGAYGLGDGTDRNPFAFALMLYGIIATALTLLLALVGSVADLGLFGSFLGAAAGPGPLALVAWLVLCAIVWNRRRGA